MGKAPNSVHARSSNQRSHQVRTLYTPSLPEAYEHRTLDTAGPNSTHLWSWKLQLKSKGLPDFPTDIRSRYYSKKKNSLQ